MNDKNKNRTAISPSHMEQNLGYALLGASKIKRVDSPCRVYFHSIRKRLADLDNLSGKAVLDGLVYAGILFDDTPKEVQEFRHTQEKGPDEKTIVVIEF